MRITVLGGGSWGTALGHMLAGKGLPVTMLLRDDALAKAIDERHENPRYLPGLPLAPALRATTEAAHALADADVLLIAVPCQQMRAVLASIAALVPSFCIPVCASKGIEVGTVSRMSEVVAGALPEQAAQYAILSGPSFAREVVEQKPAAVVLGCADAPLGEKLRAVFSCGSFRVYSSTDVKGVELGGAVKNVMAIAAGLCDGMNLGHNARAALITRGLVEMGRLGEVLGARASTFMGLSGLGDLVLTCTGDLSRNRQVGLRLAAGESLEEISTSMRMVAEGVKTTEAVCQIARAHDVDLPISAAVSRVLEGQPPRDVVAELMARALKEE